MDETRARFILSSFRPDGQDAGDADFAEALQLAMENRELGEWLAAERATDAAFAEALGSVELPPHLREDILACLAASRGEVPQVVDALDAALVGAFAAIQPPAAMREQILAAMDRTVMKERPQPSIFRRWTIPLAAAAGIALALIVTHENAPDLVARSAPVPIEAVKAGFVRTFESPDFSLEEEQADPAQLVAHLRQRDLPCPGRIPAGLRKYPSLGCRELNIGGRRGSLICFNLGADGLVHLVIFRRADVEGNLPGKADAEIVHNGDWSSTRWAADGRVYLVMTHASPERLAELL